MSPSSTPQPQAQKTGHAEKANLLLNAPDSPTPAEMKKISILQAKISKLQAQLQDMEAQQRDVDAKLKTKSPQTLVQEHIRLLHEYNEIRDVGQGLMGMIADQRGVKAADVYEEFEVGEGD